MIYAQARDVIHKALDANRRLDRIGEVHLQETATTLVGMIVGMLLTKAAAGEPY